VTPATEAFSPPISPPAELEAQSLAPEPPAPSAPVQSLSRDLPREEVVRNFGNPSNFLAQVSAEPYYENGRFAGYYVQNVKPGSYASSLGLRTGDVLETVNGELIDTIQKAFRLLGLIQRAPEMNVIVRRGGERTQLCYRLQ
jgi:type II secretory pathway component PulC